MQQKKFFQIVLLIISCCLLTINQQPAANSQQPEPGSQNPESRIQQSEPIVSKILVEIKNIPGNETYWTELARSLIFLKQGQSFSTDLLQDSVDALKLSKKFQNIHIDSKEEGGEKIAIIFSLTPFQLIKDIKIEGAFPLFEKEILNTMSIYTGDAFVQNALAKQEKLITELFQREGFVAPTVSVTAAQDPEDKYFIIYVNIKRGPYYILKDIDIEGNKAFSDQRLKLRMKVWLSSMLPGKTGRFVEENLKKDIKSLVEYYRKKGYADADITFSAEKETETHNVSVMITINEGPMYNIEFKGNEEFWSFTLKDDLVFSKEGNKNDLGIKKSIKNIKTRYRKAGYLEADVTVEDKIINDKPETIRSLCFVIQEGPQSVVNAIQISGNQAFDEEKIKKQMLTQLPSVLNKGAFVPETLKEDIDAIKSLYIQNGYMNPEIREDVQHMQENLTLPVDKRLVSVSLYIEEGKQTVVSSVKINGMKSITTEEAYKSIVLKEGEPFREYVLQTDENALAAAISEKGYPHVSVKGEAAFNPEQTEAEVVYTVDEGPHVATGEIYYTGNFRTKERIIKNEVQLKTDESFSLKKMLETQRNIRDIDAFDSVQFKAIGLKEKADKVSLFVEMEERKPYFIQMGAGYDTEKLFYTHAKAGDHNLFGTNKDAWIGGEISQIGYHAETGITEPRLFGSRISATVNLFADQEEKLNQIFGTRTYGASLGFHKKWLKHITTGLSFRFERREQFERDSVNDDDMTETDENQFERRSILVTTPSVSYDTRDSFVRPRKGTYSSLSVDISNGIENSMDNFFKYRLDTRFYWTPLSRLTFAVHGKVGYIDPFDSSGNVPDDQLFFLGGTSDVRGFDENLLRFDENEKPLGGRSAISGSLEARIDLGLNFELAGFYDVGKVDNVFDDDTDGKYRSTVGLGLRYITPIGPVGFLYGIKLDREESESYGRFHFSLGYTF